MRIVAFAVLAALMLLSARGDRRAYALFIVLGLAYFPISAGFTLEPRACRIAFGWNEATMSFVNVGHIVLFAIFFLMTLAQFPVRNARAMAWSAVATLAMGAAVEAAQGITGHGNCRLRDLIPDAAGIIAAATIVLLWRRLRVERGGGMLLLVLGVLGCGEAPYVVTKDLSYDPAIGIYGMFDVYEPKGDTVRTSRPAIIAIHGGAWRTGDKVWGEQIAEALCPQGYVVFSVNYRLAGRPNSTWPAQIKDVQQAVRYIRANAPRFRIDPERVASLGMSAGGHLATMVALRDDATNPTARVNVAVNLDGEHDMTMPPAQVMDDFESILADVMGHPAPWSDAELRDISTVTFARPDVAVLTIHGAGDDNVYVAQGERIHAALKATGAESEFVRLDGSEGNCHSDCWRVPRARSALQAFLDRKLTRYVLGSGQVWSSVAAPAATPVTPARITASVAAAPAHVHPTGVAALRATRVVEESVTGRPLRQCDEHSEESDHCQEDRNKDCHASTMALPCHRLVTRGCRTSSAQVMAAAARISARR